MLTILNLTGTTMKPTTTASLLKELRTNPAAALSNFTDLQLYAIRFWYEQYHLLSPRAPRVFSLSGEKIAKVLLWKIEDYEAMIFLERLKLICDHYPERVRWHKKMVEGYGGGFGLKARVMENICGEDYLQVNWEKVTEEEKEFVWWW